MKHLLLALALTFPLAALAETREERLAAANDYVELSLDGFDMAAVIETMYQPVLQQVQASGQSLSEPQVAEIRQLYLDTFSQPMTDLMRGQSEIMADLMTLSEINALRGFYTTPEGKSVMTKLPQVMAAQQPQVMALVNNNMGVLLPKLQAIIAGQ